MLAGKGGLPRAGASLRGLSPINCDPGAEVDRENPKNAKSARAVSAPPQRRDDNAGHHQSHAGETKLGRDYRAEPLPQEQTHVVHPTAEPSIDARVHASVGHEQSQGDQEHHGAADLEHEPPLAVAAAEASHNVRCCRQFLRSEDSPVPEWFGGVLAGIAATFADRWLQTFFRKVQYGHEN
jgi:hypothetical protein